MMVIASVSPERVSASIFEVAVGSLLGKSVSHTNVAYLNRFPVGHFFRDDFTMTSAMITFKAQKAGPRTRCHLERLL